MSRGYRNFNPGNIRQSDVAYTGEVEPSKDPAFKQFRTMSHGYRAMFVLLHTYSVKYHLKTLREMIERYAPPVENDTTEYVNFVSSRAKVADISTVDTMNECQMIPIVAAMARVENGSDPDMDEIRQGWDLFVRDYA